MVFFGEKFPICDCFRSNALNRLNNKDCAPIYELPSNISTMVLVAQVNTINTQCLFECSPEVVTVHRQTVPMTTVRDRFILYYHLKLLAMSVLPKIQRWSRCLSPD